jgi:hypothetical protein
VNEAVGTTEDAPRLDPAYIESGPPGCACCFALIVWLLIAVGIFRFARRRLSRRGGDTSREL